MTLYRCFPVAFSLINELKCLMGKCRILVQKDLRGRSGSGSRGLSPSSFPYRSMCAYLRAHGGPRVLTAGVQEDDNFLKLDPGQGMVQDATEQGRKGSEISRGWQSWGESSSELCSSGRNLLQ